MGGHTNCNGPFFRVFHASLLNSSYEMNGMLFDQKKKLLLPNLLARHFLKKVKVGGVN
tara:strand:+ start:303 stop:476 length:174 start_codon:yes stop_codon:yes gene_type:complete